MWSRRLRVTLLVGVLTSALTACLLVVVAPPAEASPCPSEVWFADDGSILRQGDVPPDLWVLGASPGEQRAYVRDGLLAASPLVERVDFYPPGWVDHPYAYVYDFFFQPGVEAPYLAAVCLGGRVPDAVSLTVAEASELVTRNGLVPIAHDDDSWIVTALAPDPGEILYFGGAREVTVSAAPPKPEGSRDLAVMTLDVAPGDAERLEIRVLVKNVGDLVAGDAQLFLEYDGGSLDAVDMPTLEPGESYEFRDTLLVPAEVQGTIWTALAWLYYDDDNQDNNQQAVDVDQRPDLVVQDVEASSMDSGVRVEAQVANVGLGVAGDTTVRMEVGGAESVTLALPALAAGDQRRFSEAISLPDQTGDVSVEVTVDPQDVIEETDEDNNSDTHTVSVTPPPRVLPDLAVQELTATETDGGIRVAGWVVNAGPGPAAGTTVSVQIDGVEPVSLPVSGLAEGDAEPFTATVALLEGSGDIKVEVTVDPTDLIDETTEDNNRIVDVVRLSSTGVLPGPIDGSESANDGVSPSVGLPGWWWIPPVVLLLAAASGLLATRTARRGRERDWVRRHVRLRPRFDPGQQHVDQDRTGRGSHTVRLEPNPGPSTMHVEEVDQR